MAVRMGLEELRGYLEANPIDVRSLDLAGFRAWLAERIDDARGDDVFEQRCRIRDLVKANRRPLAARVSVLKRAKKAYEASPAFERLTQLESEIVNARKAVDGLSGAIGEGRTGDPEASAKKLDGFRERLETLLAEDRALAEATPERGRLTRAEASLEAYRVSIGIVEGERSLEGLHRARGQRASSKGSRFEEVAGEAIERHLVPAMPVPRGRLVRLGGVKLGCARAEFDHLVVDVPPEGGPVEVVALLEVKRNPNDIVDGFLVRQENLAWFTGERGAYDPEAYRTQVYRTGHFDRPAVHEEDGAGYPFDATSFRRFARDPATGKYLEALWFVTEPRRLRGVTSEENSRILHRVSTDPSFDLGKQSSVREFRRWAFSILGESQTRDVLALYARSEALARHILFCDRST